MALKDWKKDSIKNKWTHKTKKNPQNGKKFFVEIIQDGDYGWLIMKSHGENKEIYSFHKKFKDAYKKIKEYMRKH